MYYVRCQLIRIASVFMPTPTRVYSQVNWLRCHFTGGINLSSSFLTHPHEALWTADEAHPAFKWISSAIDTLMDVAQNPGCKFGRRVAGAGARQKLAAAFYAVRDLIAPSNKYANCVCHGDVWNNNVMLKYNGRGEAEAARIVDMQVRVAHKIRPNIYFLILIKIWRFLVKVKKIFLCSKLSLKMTLFRANILHAFGGDLFFNLKIVPGLQH